jgi:cell division initiation protein
MSSSRFTAMDIEKQEFARKMRGYDAEEVRMFLRSVAEEVERLNLENGRLREDLGKFKSKLDELRGREETLQKTLVTAQQVGDELKERARADADLKMREAKFEAERIVQRAQDRLQGLQSEIERCVVERESFEQSLRSMIEQHLTLLNLRREARGKKDGNVHVLRRTGSEAG